MEICTALQTDVVVFRSVSFGWTMTNNTRILHGTFLQQDKLLVSPVIQDHKYCILFYCVLSFHGNIFVSDQASLEGSCSWPFPNILLLLLPAPICTHPHVSTGSCLEGKGMIYERDTKMVCIKTLSPSLPSLSQGLHLPYRWRYGYNQNGKKKQMAQTRNFTCKLHS